MKVNSINLNLLTILDAVLTEQNVTNAARRINLSQPRVSNALKELRELFDDDLLVRNRHGQMTLTAKSRELQVETRRIINEIENLFENNQPFKPATSAANFNIAMSDYISVAFLPFLTRYLKKHAPNITLSIYGIEYVTGKNRSKIYETIDFVIGSETLLKANDEFSAEFLFEDEIVCAASSSHEIFKNPRITDNEINSFPQIYITPYDIVAKSDQNKLDNFDRLQNTFSDKTNLINSGNATMPVSRIMIACNMLANSDMVCIAPRRILNPVYEYFNLQIKPSPFYKSKIKFYQYLKKSSAENKQLNWLKNTINQLASEL
ncbi:LysR family transcriptional regulator [Lentisphaerota bacterium ZTH]|nr:LysR family transcriptional regulator [Lentisphaerota bacterium]WET07233.1 LysR family transcriptional regulator [Lentisphaerota bacterium ZTH]